jgi:hypothetical protein
MGDYRGIATVTATLRTMLQDLAQQVVPGAMVEPMGNEELSRLWTIFSQVPYALSVAYRCGVLLLQPAVLTAPPLPVAVIRTTRAAVPQPTSGSFR